MLHKCAAVVAWTVILGLAGAGPTTRHADFVLRCRLTGTGLGNAGSPTLNAFDGQEWAYLSGGTFPTPRANSVMEYGTALRGFVTSRPDGSVLLDLSLAHTEPLVAGSTLTNATIVGGTAHTIRIVRLGDAVHLALGDAAGAAVDVTVSRH